MKRVHVLCLAVVAAVLAFIVAMFAPSAQAQESAEYVTGVRFDEAGGINTSVPDDSVDVDDTIYVTGYRRHNSSNPYPDGPRRIEDSSFGPPVIIYRQQRGLFFAQTEVVLQSTEHYRGPDFSNRIPHFGLAIPTPLFGEIE